MIAELLDKVNEVDFADIFKPVSREELDKRWAHIPKYIRDLKPVKVTNITDHVSWVYFDHLSVDEIKKVLDKKFGDPYIDEYDEPGIQGRFYRYNNGNVVLRSSHIEPYTSMLRIYT